MAMTRIATLILSAVLALALAGGARPITLPADTAGLIGTTFVFCLPGSPGACRDAWDHILADQFDLRHRPCNFVEIMPRLDEHLRRAKLKSRP